MLLEVDPSLDGAEPILTIPASIEASEWQGTVIHRYWKAPDNHFRWFDTAIYETSQGTPTHWALIATAIGDIAMHPDFIERLGDEIVYVRWRNIGLNLLAVV